jgi:methionine-rich copper-binding protein CopC
MVIRAAAWPMLTVAIALSLAQGAPASAHAALSRADPRVGSTVATSPTEVRMWFSQALEPAFSGASILGATGPETAAEKAVVDPQDRRQLVIPLSRRLAAGRYQVKWGVVSVDGHRTEGDFRFTVGGAR